MTTTLTPDRGDLANYFDAVFRYASGGVYVAHRVYPDGGRGQPINRSATRVGDGCLIDDAVAAADIASNHHVPSVYCPPVAGFHNATEATEAALVEAYAMTVDCDHHPVQSRQLLEDCLGPATAVVATGGQWVNPVTGEVEDKQHLHWRLTEPACGAELDRLKTARKIATQKVGGDPSGVNPVHPFRAPGSWHRKGEPRLATIVALNASAEIELGDALDRIGEMQPAPWVQGEISRNSGNSDFDAGRKHTGGGRAQSDELISGILSGDAYHANLVALSARWIGDGMSHAAVVKNLRALMDASTGPRDSRWSARYADIPRIVSSAVAKFGSAEEWPTPIPLIDTGAKPEPYPIHALGSVLSEAANAISDATQCPPEIAAQSVLAVASLAVQAHADVRLPTGQTRPLSLYIVSVAASGERKSAADAIALAPVRAAEKQGGEALRAAWPAYCNGLEAWQAQRRQITNNRKLDMVQRRNALHALGEEPKPPLSSDLVTADMTIEGLVKSWVNAKSTRGLFTAEGGVFAAGTAMSDENRIKTAATFSGLWDDGRADRIRGGDGVLRITGRRLAIHVMIQPEASRRLLAARDLTDQGLTARMLITAPVSAAGSRLFKEVTSDDPRLDAYNDIVVELLNRPPVTADGRNEATPPAIALSSSAREVWIKFHDHVERQLGRDGPLAGIRGFGGKLAEHAGRLAGVLAVFADPATSEITETDMINGCTLADFYAGETLRLSQQARVSPELEQAEQLRRWLATVWTEPAIAVTDAQRFGPNALRDKTQLQRLFMILADHNLLRAVGAGDVAGQRRRECWAINPAIRP